jgi:hypothetical protein
LYAFMNEGLGYCIRLEYLASIFPFVFPARFLFLVSFSVYYHSRNDPDRL